MAAKNSVHVADTQREKMHERLWHNSPSATTCKEILRFVLQAVVGEIMMKEVTQNCAHPKVYGNSTALSWASADCFHRVRQPREYETWSVLMLSRQSNTSLPFPPPSSCEHVSFLSHSAHCHSSIHSTKSQDHSFKLLALWTASFMWTDNVSDRCSPHCIMFIFRVLCYNSFSCRKPPESFRGMFSSLYSYLAAPQPRMYCPILLSNLVTDLSNSVNPIGGTSPFLTPPENVCRNPPGVCLEC
jgi:hypothetical protein